MRVLIVGGGIAGLTTAHCLEKAGHRVLVVERGPAPRTEGYMIDFLGPGFDAADRLGLLDRLAAIHYPIGRLAFANARGRVIASVPYPRLRARLFHDRHFNFMRGDLEQVLLKAVEGRVEVLFGHTVDMLVGEGHGVRARLEDGREEHVDLVVGADGVYSSVASMAFAGAVTRTHLGCRTAAYLVERAGPALPEDAFLLLSGRGWSAAAYPVRGGKTATFFLYACKGWVETRDAAACRAALERHFRGRAEIVDRLLDGFPDNGDVLFDDVSQVEVARWSNPGVVLVGDACGCVSLLGGQGASMAMAGGYVLAQEITRAPDDLARALGRYERRVRPAVEARQRVGRRTRSWFLPRSSLWADVQHVLLAAAVRTPLASSLGRFLSAAPLSLD